MTDSLEYLSKKLEKELGLVANVVPTDDECQIVGGTGYDDRGGVGLYIKKYEVFIKKNHYKLMLPVGQTYMEYFCDSDDAVLEQMRVHFGEYFPDIKLGSSLA